ncbi:NusG domain II-containing protein [Peptoniphilus equinus]|uniref:NusG domain II-containing protein n=1 Tax=Peptoniphilus equinus TaxID=3016343 RepID=A0ABY7QWU4_9FIRM|nr:NusG domain II-containing protein [Peptoniphilus equinus]WBW50560.1 NusG domain II-containing protein [Peptoniphilus equinus]
MKKGDFLVVFGILVTALTITWFGQNTLVASTANDVVVQVDGKQVGRYSIKDNEGKTIEINNKYGHNAFVIENGKVHMSHSDCRDQLCMHMPAISKSNETIVCLPNRLVLTVLAPPQAPGNDVDVVLH